MFPWHFSLFLFLTNHSLFLYSSSLAVLSLLSSQVILSSVATFALSNGPSKNVVRLGLLSPLNHGRRISQNLKCLAGNNRDHGIQNWAVPLSPALWSSLTSFWPNGMWGGLHEMDAVKLTLLACRSVGESWWQWALLWKQREVCMLSDPSVAMNQTQSKTLESITT